ncbi:MAG: endonuclease/exonuclease/phosphatase family protein [Candidatus Limnocylindrales bacterium]
MDRLAAPDVIRVMVFNIENGGTGVALDRVVEAIRRADPDIVALEEAMGNAGPIAAALGWGFASNRSQLISRHPIVDPSAGEGVFEFVEIRLGRVVAVANVHLPSEPYGPSLVRQGVGWDAVVDLESRVRLPEIERILGHVAGLAQAGIPLIVLGDFNAPSHLDWTAGREGPGILARPAIAWPVSRAVAVAGLRDSWREVHGDPRSKPGFTWWAARPPVGRDDPGPADPEDRIDFIYCAGPIETVDSQLVGEAGRPDVAIAVMPWPSDHRALVSSFRVRGAANPDPVGSAPVVAQRAADRVRLRSARQTYRVGEPIELDWAQAPANRWDWIGLFPAPARLFQDGHLVWAHTRAQASGSVRLDASSAIVDQSPTGGAWPIPAGEYEAAYLLDDMDEQVAWTSLMIVP